MFKILLCRMDRTGIYGHQRDAFQESLKKIANVTTVTNSLQNKINRGQYVKALFDNKVPDYKIPPKLPTLLEKDNYDFIFVDCEIGMFYYEPWSEIKIPKISTLHDLHVSKKFASFMIKNDFDMIVTRYKNSLYDLIPELRQYKYLIRWQPGCVNINLFKDYKELKKYDVTMAGKISNFYSKRQQIKKYFQNKPYFNYVERPRDNDPNAWPIDLDYAKLLNQSKICISTGGKYNYPFMKNFEITACKSLLMVNDFKELNELGFYDTFNFISLSENIELNEEKLLEYLNNDVLRELTVLHGYNHTRLKHNSDYRAKEFINILCEYKNIKLAYPEIGINKYKYY